MQTLEALARDASALANGETVLSAPETEVARQMQICNACRYCEGFCAVFPAMTRRLEFGKADIHFLANLCHNCGACLHACQYAPPHEFAVNVPQAMAQVRGQTYVDYAWPPALGRLYQRQGLTLSLALAAGLALFLVLSVVLQGQGLGALWSAPGSDFYGLFPHNLLVSLFAPVFLFATLALCLGVRRFWRELTPATSGAPLAGRATACALAGSGSLRTCLDWREAEAACARSDWLTRSIKPSATFTLLNLAIRSSAAHTRCSRLFMPWSAKVSSSWLMRKPRMRSKSTATTGSQLIRSIKRVRSMCSTCVVSTPAACAAAWKMRGSGLRMPSLELSIRWSNRSNTAASSAAFWSSWVIEAPLPMGALLVMQPVLCAALMRRSASTISGRRSPESSAITSRPRTSARMASRLARTSAGGMPRKRWHAPPCLTTSNA